MFTPLDRMWDRVEVARSDSDAAFFRDLMLLGEMVLKTTVSVLVSSIADDRDRSRYQQIHRLVRADSLGDWAAVLDEVLTGPSSQRLLAPVRQDARLLTEKLGTGSWQYDAAARLHECVSLVDTRLEKLGPKIAGRIWFRLFAQLRNRKAHGAQATEMQSRISRCLEPSLRTLTGHLLLFSREWTYLYRNLSGKYRVTRLTESTQAFDYLKRTTSETLPNGVYVFLDRPVRVELIHSDPEASDFYLPNGAFDGKHFEMLSYITDDRVFPEATPYLDPPGPLPRSETEGMGSLDVLGNCFTNLPQRPQEYIARKELETDLEELLKDYNHSIVTLHGSGGIGKTSLALYVLSRVAFAPRFSVLLWFSARDIDLLPEGPKPVKPHVLEPLDVAREYVRLVEPEKSADPKVRPVDILARELAESSIGPVLFVFDNFETVTSPADFFKWIDTHVRSPNKVLITARHRDFRGDYPLEVGGMSEDECEKLVTAASERLGIFGLLTTEYRHELYRESGGHPYAIKILLGEVAKRGKLLKIERVFASREDILTALFERTYASLSPAAKRVFLTLCNWRSSVPVLALEAVTLRPQNERMNVAEALDELGRYSFVQEAQSPSDKQLFVSVPLVAAEFGLRKLAVSSLKTAIQSDTELLHQFGASSLSDVKHGIAPRVERLFGSVASKVQRGESLTAYMPMLEFISMKYPRGWLLIAKLYEEAASPVGLDVAKDAVRHFLETASGDDAYAEWKHLADLCRSTGDAQGELQALVERCELSCATIRDHSFAANRLNTLYGKLLITDSNEKRLLVERLVRQMEKRGEEASATDHSRLGWLYLHLDNEPQARAHAEKGLEAEPDNEYCRNLFARLR